MRCLCAALGSALTLVACLDWDQLEPLNGTAAGGSGAAGGTPGAFPEARGFGATALSDCDRDQLRVVVVDSLSDDGVGSLRWAIEEDAPEDEYRVVVFETSGTIELTGPIIIDRPCLYVAGQTAPSGGITLTHASSGSLHAPLLKIETSETSETEARDVVLRYLRLRGAPDDGGLGDNIEIQNGTRIMIDHLSLAYAHDDNISIVTENSRQITVQRTLLAAPLGPDPGDEGHGMMIGRADAPGWPDSVSIHHNLFAHSAKSNPTVGSGENVQFINNVVYNWTGPVGRTASNNVTLDLIGNFWKPGPWGGEATFEHSANGGAGGSFSVYFEGNYADATPLGWESYTIDGSELPPGVRRNATQAIAGGDFAIDVQDAQVAYGDVLGDVGANKRKGCNGEWVLENADARDQFVLDSIEDGVNPPGGGPSNDPADYWGYPNLEGGDPCADSDHDGMPDLYEQAHGGALDPAADADNDGYANLEEYLNNPLLDG